MSEGLSTVVGPSLEDLATTANREHVLCGQSLRAGLSHSVTAGEALLTAREIVGHGRWIKWIADNFVGGLSTARRYMRCAEHRERLTSDMTVHDAITVLAGLETTALKPHAEHPHGRREQAIGLVRDEGFPIAAAAREVGAAYGSVQRWVDPTAVRKQRATATERRRQANAALAREQSDREIRRAVRAAGAALAEAYSVAERMQDVLAQAQREVESAEARAALDRAGSYYRKMRDEIVRALGVV